MSCLYLGRDARSNHNMAFRAARKTRARSRAARTNAHLGGKGHAKAGAALDVHHVGRKAGDLISSAEREGKGKRKD